ncbi:MAG: ROK family protein [Lachnospiraceae bacterium]|nr:ROK family protein [Lachnospiraceae bacterium]
MKIGALEAGGTKMVCAIYDDNSALIKKETFPTKEPSKTLPVLIGFFKKEGIDALGIGSFGPVDLDKGSPTYGYITKTPKEGWKDTDIAGLFKRELKIPVGFDTDVNCSAIGEHEFGIGKDVDSLVYITIGTGIGIGVISEGKVIHGAMHPEGGHIMLTKSPKDPSGSVCPYHDSCFEGLCSGPSIEKRWGKKGADLSDDPKVWELEACYIAQAVFTYTAVLSPKRIILGGGVMHQSAMLPLIREKFSEYNGGYINNKFVNDPDTYIVLQSLDDEQGILGAYILGLRALGKSV